MHGKLALRLIALMLLLAIASGCSSAFADGGVEIVGIVSMEAAAVPASLEEPQEIPAAEESVEPESASEPEESIAAEPIPEPEESVEPEPAPEPEAVGEDAPQPAETPAVAEEEVADDTLLPGQHIRADREDVINILLIGSDERTKEFSDTARGDTCMLFSLNKRDGGIRIISFERALGIPMHEGSYKGKTDWLTHVFHYGGAKLVKNELSTNFGLSIDCYVRVNIRTFVALIDAIGGIDMELTSAECGYINGSGNYSAREIGMGKQVQHVKKGLNHLNGVTAMVYARCRKIDSDWKRVERQRKVIIAAIEQLSQADLGTFANVAMELLPLVETDVPLALVTELIALMPKFVHAETTQMTVPTDGRYKSTKGLGGRSVNSVDFDRYSADLDSFLYGE